MASIVHGGQVGLRQGQTRRSARRSADPMPELADHAGDGGKRHLLAHRQHQRFEQQGEARQLARPSGSTRRTRPSGSLTRGTRTSRIAFMLEEVEMPVALGLGVVDRMHARHAGHREPTSGDKVDADRQGACLGIEIRAGDKPGRPDSQRRFEEFLGHTHSPELRQGY